MSKRLSEHLSERLSKRLRECLREGDYVVVMGLLVRDDLLEGNVRRIDKETK